MRMLECDSICLSIHANDGTRENRVVLHVFECTWEVEMANQGSILKIGDIVTLKSGGPKMTVRKEIGNSKWECLWFTKNDELKSDTFMVDVLRFQAAPQPDRDAIPQA